MMRANGRTHCWAFIFAQWARCAAAILFRAARLILRTGFDALARFIFPCAQRCFEELRRDDLRLANAGKAPDSLVLWCYTENKDQQIPAPGSCGASH